MGIKFQAKPRDAFSEVIIHVRMLDNETTPQQEALGIVGVNLIHGAFESYTVPEDLLASLLDGLSTDRIEVDMVDFSGQEFQSVDNRVMSLRLVQLGLSEAAMFSPDGTVLQASEVLRKRPVLVERGSFRPITNVNVDMFRCAHTQFLEELEDGILEAFGRLFKTDLKLYIYPLRNPESGDLTTTDTLKVADDLEGLYRFLISRGRVEAIRDFSDDVLHIFSKNVLNLIREGDPAWQDMVPKEVAKIIRSRGLFGYTKPG